MKAQLEILKTCSLAKFFWKNKNNYVLREHLKIRSMFDPLKVYNYHFVKVFKENIYHFILFFHLSTHI